MSENKNYSTSKLHDVLKALRRDEWNSLRGFISFETGSEEHYLLDLYNCLSDLYKVNPGFDLSRKELFLMLFPDRNFNDSRIRHLMSEFYKVVCRYLVYNTVLQKEQDFNSLLRESLVVRKADKAYRSIYGSDENSGQDDARLSSEHYYYRFRDLFTHMNYYMPRQKRTFVSPVEIAAGELDKFYLGKKLQLLCEAVNSGNVAAVNVGFVLKDELIKALENGVYNDIPVVRIYYTIYLSITDADNESHFINLSRLVSEYAGGFTAEELREMYQYLMNYCIRKINTGNTVYVSKLLAIYKTLLEQELIFQDGVLSQWDYKNIVATGIRAGDLKWVGTFIWSYKNRLDEAERENAFIYNCAYYYYATKEYKKALSLLQQVGFTDLYYQLDSRSVLLKCYYETGDEDALFYHLAAFKIFLTRNKTVSDYQRTIYRNLIRFTSRIVNALPNRKKLQKIKSEIDEVKQIADLGWLKTQLEKEMRNDR